MFDWQNISFCLTWLMNFTAGPWRWFDENMLDCCEPLEKVKDKGISFGKVVCLAHCAGAKVEAFRTNQSTIDDFRKYVMACTSSDDCHVISSYNRGTFKQVNFSYVVICFKILSMTMLHSDRFHILNTSLFFLQELMIWIIIIADWNRSFFTNRWISCWKRYGTDSRCCKVQISSSLGPT